MLKSGFLLLVIGHGFPRQRVIGHLHAVGHVAHHGVERHTAGLVWAHTAQQFLLLALL